MGFAFRLERVLSVRRIQEDEAQRKHADARAELRAADESLQLLESMVVNAQRQLDELKHRDQLTAEALHLFSLHMAGMRRRVAAARVRVETAQDEVDQTSAELLEAHRARETLERLRGREEAAWRKRQAQLEVKQLDEIAVSRHRAREEENHGP